MKHYLIKCIYADHCKAPTCKQVKCLNEGAMQAFVNNDAHPSCVAPRMRRFETYNILEVFEE
jgi:hypothetical protein